jgi:isocitrate lyase
MNLEFNSLENIQDFLSNNRWSDVKRTYSPEDISKLRPPIQVSYTLSEFGSKNLWDLLNRGDQWVSSLGVATAQQAAQLYNLNYEMIYVSGWQVAAESNNGVNTYPDLSLYPSNSGPDFVQKINNTLLRIMTEKKVSYLPPVVADAESGFGGIYNVYNLTQQFIASGLAGIHFEDQLAAEKKCGHMGGKVVIPTGEYLKKLAASRLSADVAGVPLVIIARTDALTAKLITSDFDERDKPFISNKRTEDGYYLIENNQELAITKSLAYAEIADVIWCETNNPDLGFAKEFADEIKSKYPQKILAYNCSPSFNWVDKFTDEEIKTFQEKLSSYGYKLQFVSLAGFHSLSSSMYQLGKEFKGGDMSAIVKLQKLGFKLSEEGYTAIKHQQEVGGNYYETIGEILLGENSNLLSTKDSTETEQF